MILKVYILDFKQDKLFFYKNNNSDVKLFDIVEVEFRKKKKYAIIIEILENNIDLSFDVKDIISIVCKNSFSFEFLSFLFQFAKYNCINIETVFGDLIPFNLIIKAKERELNKKEKNEKYLINFKNIKDIFLTEEQRLTFEEIQLKSKENKAILFQGVTGSGKTAIYLNFALERLKKGKQVLILIPQIGLSEQIAKKIEKYINYKPLIWHSGVSQKKKLEILQIIKSKEPAIFLGARSILMLPYENLDAIIVDEEHDESYKQNEFPVYHARDMAVLLAQNLKIPLLLSSATPSVESILNCYLNKYEKVVLSKRFFINSSEPRIKVLKHFNSEKDIFHQESLKKIEEMFKKKQQSLIFINKRGYSKTVYCKDCKKSPSCKNCDNFLTFHKSIKSLKCHYCGYREVFKDKCTNLDCMSLNIIEYGSPGVEKVEEAIKNYFPNIKTLIFSSDTLKNAKTIEDFAKKIENNEVDLIIGTSIVSKGYHFPNLNFVCVIENNYSEDGDIRCNERLFHLIYQIKGRAGREKEESDIFIQTSNPDNKVIRTIEENKFEEFYKEEILLRKNSNLPPFWSMIALIIASEKKEKSSQKAKEIIESLKKNILDLSSDLRILGPAESFLHYTKRHYRYRILIKFPKNNNLATKIKEFLKSINKDSDIQVKIDVDPYNFI